MDNLLIGDFEGPLDLLLHLIKKSKMEIFDIEISEITKEYLNYIKEMTDMNLDIASEYLVMAAELIEMKSRKLLPNKKDEEEKEEEESGEDKKDDKKELFKLAKPCFSHFVEFLKSAMKCIRVEKLENHLIFGMDSYVETAKYIGYIWSLMIIVNSSHKNAKLSAQPSFNGSILDGNGDNELEINILKLIPPVIRLVLKKEVRTLIKGAIK